MSVTSAPRSKRDRAQLAEFREQARKARRDEWQAKALADAPPLTQAQIDLFRPVFAPVLHLINGSLTVPAPQRTARVEDGIRDLA